MIAFNFPNVFKRGSLSNDEYEYIEYGINDKYVSTVFKYAHLFIRNDQNIDWSKQVLQSTSKTIEECDDIYEFFSTYYENTNNPKDRIPKSNIFDKFKDLYGVHELSRHKTKFYKKFEKFLNPLDIYRNTDYKYIKLKKITNNDDDLNFDNHDVLSSAGDLDD